MNAVDLGSRYLVAEREGGVLRVRLNRPERRNACTMEMYNGIKRAAVIADNDAEIDVVILTGTDNSFAVGGDMSGTPEDPTALAAQADPLDMIPFAAIERCSKVFVAAVNGLCHAGGLDLMMACDISVAARSASFRAPELMRGVADGWLGARLPQRVGVPRAKYLMFTGATLDAEEALAWGLLSQVVADDALQHTVSDIAERVCQCAPQARAALKKQVNQQLPPFDVEIFARSLRSAEMVEGFSAFLEKRVPKWPR